MSKQNKALLFSSEMAFRTHYAGILENNAFATVSKANLESYLRENHLTPDICLVDNRDGSFEFKKLFEYLERDSPKTVVLYVGLPPADVPVENRYLYKCVEDRVPLASVLQNLAEYFHRGRSRTELAAMLIHDVRSPLHSLMNYLELILNQTFGALNEGQKNFLEKTMVLGDQVLDMLEDLNEIYTSEQYVFSIDKSDFNIANVINQSLVGLWIQSDKKNQKIVMDVDSNLPPVNGDAFQIQRVLLNLVSNAIKYCPPKSQITIRAQRVTKRHVEVAVIDNGGGIPEEDLKRVFRKAFRVKEHLKQNEKGFGLGLYICKIIIKAHGGTIRAENNEHGGVSFILSLPVSEIPAKGN